MTSSGIQIKRMRKGRTWDEIESVRLSSSFPVFSTPQQKIRHILMYQSKKSQRKYDVSIQGYTGIGKIPMTTPKTIIRNFLIVLGIVIGILPIPVYPYVS